ncbi:MAG: EAL domain-containing protein [Synergistaceae bacterium]|jgi:EAL domain-containing protein (putative c-di-GMP-specific phosphodiesterase class I)/ligand-binding sensor protein|nr:EAL domain-containing protein [Synergistaceae bacterium]
MNTMNNAVKLADFIDFGKIQQLQDSFAEMMNVALFIVDHEGNALTAPSGQNSVCEQHIRAKLCQQSLADSLEPVQKNSEMTTVTCPRTGKRIALMPIVLNDICMGALIVEEIHGEKNRKKSKTSAEPEKIKEETPASRGPGRDFQTVLNFGETIKTTISWLATVNIKLREREKTLENLTEQVNMTNRMLRKFIDFGEAAMYVSDFYTGEVLMANHAWSSRMGQPTEKIIGSRCWSICNTNSGMFGDTFCAFCPRHRLLNVHGEPSSPFVETHCEERSGTWLRCTHQAIYWEDGRLAHMVTQTDVTQEYAMQEKLSRLAYYDLQTSLPNEHRLLWDLRDVLKQNMHEHQEMNVFESHFDFRSQPHPERPPEAEEKVSLICFDLSAVHQFDDVYSRNTCNELLRSILNWYSEQNFGRDPLYRIEGYEFCLLLRSRSGEETRRVAEAISNRFTQPWVLSFDGEEFSFICDAVVSIIFVTRENILRDEVAGLIRRTLSSAHKNRTTAHENRAIIVYDADMDRQQRENIRLGLDLRNCVRQEMSGFDLVFQPIVELASGTWKGLEALCRWTCPERGRVSPGVFIPEAEHLGLIGTMGRWILETAVERCKNLKLDAIDGFFLSVNVSPLQLMDETFANQVLETVDRHEYPCDRLNLEITESSEVSFTLFTLSQIEKLRQNGVRIAVDDFGTGYSSFNSLKNLPVTFLKTERDFVLNIEQENSTQYFFQVISEVAHTNGMMLIAEGIENQKQFEILRNKGVDYIQGYFFSEPLPFDVLKKQLGSFRRTHRAFKPSLSKKLSYKFEVKGLMKNI